MDGQVQQSKKGSKIKKKSFMEKIADSFSHTVKIGKKSSHHGKGKSKKSEKLKTLEQNTFDSSKPLLDTARSRRSDTFTYCDVCDKEIIVDNYNGETVICHDRCKMRHIEQFGMAALNVLSSDVLDCDDGNDALTHLTMSMEGSLRSSEDNDGNMETMRRLSCSAEDISSTSGSVWYDGTNTVVLATGGSGQKTSLLPAAPFDSYTFSTIDFSTIRRAGISVAVENTPVEIQTLKVDSLHNDDDLLVMTPELQRLVDIFNENSAGLHIYVRDNQLAGTMRIFINLLRPVRLLLTARPPSIFDQAMMMGDNNSGMRTVDRAYHNEPVVFRLPRGTSKVLHVNINTNADDVISMLLEKFNIRNNPRKFALYEHTIASPQQLLYRKLRSYECPLNIMLDWCIDGPNMFQNKMESRRFVLQENDPGFIEWNDFSIPELTMFLHLLNQEESDKKDEVIRKFDIIRSDIKRRLCNESCA